MEQAHCEWLPKIAACVAALKKMMEHKNTQEEKQSTTTSDGVISVVVEEDTTHNAAGWTEFMEEGDPDDVDNEEDCYKSELKGNACKLKFDNTDLSAIING